MSLAQLNILGRIAALAMLRPIVADLVAWSVCWSVTAVSPASKAEPIEMPFGLRTWAGPRNHVLDGVRSPCEGAILGGRGGPL